MGYNAPNDEIHNIAALSLWLALFLFCLTWTQPINAQENVPGSPCAALVPPLKSAGDIRNTCVGERQKIHRQLDARGLCGLEVDDEPIVCRRLERQISRPRLGRQDDRQ